MRYDSVLVELNRSDIGTWDDNIDIWVKWSLLGMIDYWKTYEIEIETRFCEILKILDRF